jgi:hypothetical protein
MAFGGQFGASGSILPAAQMRAASGELGASINADGQLVLTRASGSTYVPETFDQFRISCGVAGTPPLAGVVIGLADPANADTGRLVSAAPGQDEHGLPTNFGPGRGKWTQADFERIRIVALPTLNVAAPATGVGSVTMVQGSVAAGDIELDVRNYFEQDLVSLILIVVRLPFQDG